MGNFAALNFAVGGFPFEGVYMKFSLLTSDYINFVLQTFTVWINFRL